MILLLDTETTGLKPPIEVIELCYTKLENKVDWHRDENLPKTLDSLKGDFVLAIKNKEVFHQFYRPSVTIDPKASAIHNIYLKDLKGCPPSKEVFIPTETTILVGYNVKFDHRVLGKPNTKLICLMEIAKHLWKKDKAEGKLENFKLVTIINYLFPDNHELTYEAHGAKTDVFLTYLLLLEVIRRLPKLKFLEELVTLTNQPT